jgi:hypothetical protein
MNSSIDLNLLPLIRQGTILASTSPDLYAVTPPRRTARGRETDSLVIYLSMTGNSPLSPETQIQLLEQLAHKFYKTTGSLTAALRTIVDSLNLYLLDRNLRSTSMGRQGIGQLLLVALKADTLYMAQCGNVHAYIITAPETQHLYDPQSSGRGLGLSRNSPIRFLQARLAAGDCVLLATNASPNWSEITLPASEGMDALRARLIETANQDFNVVIIQAQAGTGRLRVLRRKDEAPEAGHPAEPTPAVSTIETETPTTLLKATESLVENQWQGIPPSEAAGQEVTAEPLADQPAAEAPGSLAGSEINAVQVEHEGKVGTTGDAPEVNPEALAGELSGEEISPTTLPQVPVEQGPGPSESEIAEPGLPSQGSTQAAEPVPSPIRLPERRKSERPEPKPFPWAKYRASLHAGVSRTAGAFWRALRNALGTIGAALLRLLKNLLPDEDVLHVPSSLMLIIAIAVPLVLAVVGGMVFLQRGRAQQYQIYYQQATEEDAKAASISDPMELRLALQTVIEDLNKAEYYTVTSQSQELRTRVTSQLDTLDAVKRMDYKQAIVGGLDSSVSVTHMIATTTDLYILNSKQGNVLHAIMTSRGYEVDPNFQCGPTYGPISVGPLVDIAELPPGSFENASVLGMDAGGNLLYCVVGDQPYSAIMAPPNTGFGEPIAFVLNQGDLYVLDPKVNAVWIYRNIEVSQQPHLFFGESVPPMQDVIDLAVYYDDLFLLHTDGHITKCTYSSLAAAPTRCDDPYPYSDNRPGRTHGPVIADAVFKQIYYSSFPERSIYLLDPQNQSIYYFSVLLALQWQYQPASTLLDGKATAFAISPNRMAFLAVGNTIYYASVP